MINIIIQILKLNLSAACVLRLNYVDEHKRSVVRFIGYYLENSSIEYSGLVAIKSALFAITREFSAHQIVIYCNQGIINSMYNKYDSIKIKALQKEIVAVLSNAGNVQFSSCIDNDELASLLDQILKDKHHYDDCRYVN